MFLNPLIDKFSKKIIMFIFTKSYKNNAGMESVEDEKRKTDPWDDSPSQKSVEVELQSLSDPVVSHESVQNPESDVSK